MTQTNSADHASRRELNLSAVLRFIYHEVPFSRFQLALKIGLNKSRISPIIEPVSEAFGPTASLVGAAGAIVDDVLTHPFHVQKEVMPPRMTIPIAAYH